MDEVGRDRFDGDLLGDDPTGQLVRIGAAAAAAARQVDDRDGLAHFSYGERADLELLLAAEHRQNAVRAQRRRRDRRELPAVGRTIPANVGGHRADGAGVADLRGVSRGAARARRRSLAGSIPGPQWTVAVTGRG